MNLLDFMIGMTGIVMPFAGVTAPTGWLFCFGQAISRATYPELFQALTLRPTGSTTSGSATISSVSQDLTSATLGYSIVGMPICGAAIPGGATVIAVTSTTITLSANATATATGVALVIAPHGIGDGSTTFNVPDSRGRVVSGRDDMGGTAANRLQASTTASTTSGSANITVASASGIAVGMTVTGSGIPVGATVSSISGTTITLSANATATAAGVAVRFSPVGDAQALGGSGGAASHTLTSGQMPQHFHQVGRSDLQVTSGGSGGGYVVSGANNANVAQTANTGSSEAHPNVQPSIVLNHIIKT